MADTVTFEIDAKAASELEAALDQFAESVERLYARTKANEEEDERRQAEFQVTLKRIDQRLANIKARLDKHP